MYEGGTFCLGRLIVRLRDRGGYLIVDQTGESSVYYIVPNSELTSRKQRARRGLARALIASVIPFVRPLTPVPRDLVRGPWSCA